MSLPGSSGVPRFRPVNRMRRFYAVCVALIVLGAVGAGSVYLVKGGGLRKSCQRVAYSAPPPLHTPVNVYNATTQGGLASQVADQLQQRGFTKGTIGNDPLRRKIRGTGELRYTPDDSDGQAQVAALRPWNAGMAPIAEQDHHGSSVDFVIGDSFTGLYPTAKPLPGQVLPCAATTAPVAN